MNAAEEQPVSPYDRIGGAPAVTEAVERFYKRLLADEDLAGFFKDTDLHVLKRHQVALISQVLEGPKSYEGRELAEAHRGMGITPAQYAAVGAHLVAVLHELGVPQDIVDHVVKVLESVAPDVIGADV
ncbi:group 1 truncated hemoglobin GlbN [Glycomyces scopariae]|uniref:Group 1 truncated hemoglobin n=1 Tax=Glycomyces sambucus TaxID=380244 RepID=A0A1G9I595_9ACTN|nr:group 1 truncated hemoglobin [Glycomyces sambucus]SDL20417.1 hemoglobin [Glycomyces sambucus]